MRGSVVVARLPVGVSVRSREAVGTGAGAADRRVTRSSLRQHTAAHRAPMPPPRTATAAAAAAAVADSSKYNASMV